VDVHCHVVPSNLPVDPTGGKLVLWPQMHCTGGHGTFTAGPVTRKFDDRSWLASRRIDFMDQHGIGLQVLSPLPELLAYWFEPAATALLCAYTNNTLAAMVESNPTRFAALGGLPMNDMALAISEARRLKALGFAGVEIGSNINGISPADARYAELLTTLEELNLSVFVHGIRPATDGRLLGPEVMGPIIGIPMDTALCVASFIATGVLDRLPQLRVGFSHGGGGIGAVIDRLQHVWNLMPDMKAAMPRSPLEEARRYFFDILTFSPQYTGYLIEKIGSNSLFVGTDFPAGGMGLMDPVGFLKQLNLSAEDWDNISHRTANRFLGR
jgi:aminocarboxymuconate-semialdehyde decarboxylase